MFDRAKQLYSLQKKAREIQSELRDIIVEAESANGNVKVEFSGEQKIESITIDETMLTLDKKNELENALKDAVAEAIKESQKIAAQKMKVISGDLGIPGL